ncbi:GNAT family N-acetyltransferase [Actinoplanes sp. NPDC023714]|uniref:GNAT family N-acetyltransferase n=1 Tax=Actinoplanes sp. NPDC023714 TaxID=3154322 RepID=UPI0033C5CB52
MQIENRPALDPELAALVTAQQRELLAAAGLAGQRIFEPHDDVAYLVGTVNGRAVACGGWQAREPGVAEITRMYVRPAHRGRGLGRQMIVALEEEALAAGRSVIRLETAAHLRAVIALYQTSGYARIPSYGDPGNVCFEKQLQLLLQ